MSKFDFAKLREQIQESGASLRQQFKTTDRRMQANQQAQITREQTNHKEKLKKGSQQMRSDPERMAEYNKRNREGYLKAKATPEYWEAYYKAIKRRDSNPEYHKKRIAASNAKVAIKIITPQGEFDSISDAARHYGLTSEGMRHRVNSDKYPDYKKIEK